MSGDGGADVFTFRDFRDSRDNGKRDVITDFSRSQKDKIDLSAIDANTNTNADDRFDFIGTDSFSATAGELRFQQNNNKTFVYGDVDGDGKADFSFQLNGSIDLKQGDFML